MICVRNEDKYTSGTNLESRILLLWRIIDNFCDRKLKEGVHCNAMHSNLFYNLIY